MFDKVIEDLSEYRGIAEKSFREYQRKAFMEPSKKTRLEYQKEEIKYQSMLAAMDIALFTVRQAQKRL